MRILILAIALCGLLVGSDSVLDWGWGNLGYQAGFTPISVKPQTTQKKGRALRRAPFHFP